MKNCGLGLALIALLGSQTAWAGQANITEGKRKSTVCQSCHGVDGNSTSAEYPKLAGQHADYLQQALLDYKSGARKSPVMAGFVAALSPQDMADLAAYFASQKGLKLKY